MDIGNPKILRIFQAKNLDEITPKGSLAQTDKSSKKIEAKRPVKDQDPQNILNKISHMASVVQASPWTCKAKFNSSTTKTKPDKAHMCLSLWEGNYIFNDDFALYSKYLQLRLFSEVCCESAWAWIEFSQALCCRVAGAEMECFECHKGVRGH